ncbi:SdrD B-like domain-containing protein [Arenibacter sp. F20364]|uniref:carboxypeptidase regulatory-like domain-containing protein n=1 Tax=Arenibacter sp. F20364 TaxID=2926415 RepID=UPI001FF59DBD|nr:SdrD B-like domain-containing protein [Arenibacter sp. F20364]MCK0188343.1 carboxypeptidase regulatory-like domain-containing protein [Arenibacter sp. F20364]
MKKILFIVMSLVLFVSCDKNNEASIIGSASADGGEVLSGITVKLYSEGTELLFDTKTDSEGNFSFTGLDAGNYYVGATITVGDVVWDTGNTPQIIYVSGEIVKEVALTLNAK